MKNKGFTLIELLAVIVILAIIALIATPVILGIIEDARKGAAERSAELVKSGVQNAYTGYMMQNNGKTPATIEAFMTSVLFTVDSADIQTEETAKADSVIVKTDDNVSCEVTPDKTNGKVKVDCTGTFAEPSDKTGDKANWTATKRDYTFTGKVG